MAFGDGLDLNKDGHFDHDDLALLKELLRNPALAARLSEDDRRVLDLDGDGELDYGDVIRLTELLLHQVDPQAGADEARMAGALSQLRAKWRTAR